MPEYGACCALDGRSREAAGLETAKAVGNFGAGRVPRELIRAYAEVKLAALSAINETECRFEGGDWAAISAALAEMIAGGLDDRFSVRLDQGSAGTSLHMNLLEALAARAGELNPGGRDFDPVQDLNLYQSTNDTFPSALTIAFYRALARVEMQVVAMQEVLVAGESLSSGIVMTGRTELQAAVPIALSQVYSAWSGGFERDRWRISKLKERLRTVALGGTAVGTGLAAPRAYVLAAEKRLRAITGLPLSRSQNLCDEISNQDKFAEAANGVLLVAVNLSKLARDLLYLGSSSVGEMPHPLLQSASTIMAAKANPVLLEFARGQAMKAKGHAALALEFGQMGDLQLNAYLPFMAEAMFGMFDSIEAALGALLRLLPLLEPDRERMERNLFASKAPLNALVASLGYRAVARIEARLEGRGLAGTGNRDREAIVSAVVAETGMEAAEAEGLLEAGALCGFAKERGKGND